MGVGAPTSSACACPTDAQPVARRRARCGAMMLMMGRHCTQMPFVAPMQRTTGSHRSYRHSRGDDPSNIAGALPVVHHYSVLRALKARETGDISDVLSRPNTIDGTRQRGGPSSGTTQVLLASWVGYGFANNTDCRAQLPHASAPCSPQQHPEKPGAATHHARRRRRNRCGACAVRSKQSRANSTRQPHQLMSLSLLSSSS